MTLPRKAVYCVGCSCLQAYLSSNSAHGGLISWGLLIHEGYCLPLCVSLLILRAQIAQRFQVLLLSVKFCLRSR